MIGDSRPLRLLFTLGRPFSPFYRAVMVLRAALYRRGILRRHRLPVVVISVGNLAMGGSGKTPMVRYIVRLLRAQGRKPAIISRGYGGRSGARVTVVADNHQVRCDAATAGDEPFLLAASLPGVPVVTSKSRVEAGRLAIDRFGVDTLVMDDGFQHLRLQRDLDLVLFHGPALLAPFCLADNRVLPGGELREPAAALARAHALIITGTQEMEPARLATAKTVLQQAASGRPVFVGRYRPARWLRRGGDGQGCMELEEARKIPAYAFCGIARPDSFHRLLTEAGFNVLGISKFVDHAIYSPVALEAIRQQARALGARILLTTEKDFVKLGPASTRPLKLPVLECSVEMILDPDFDRFISEYFH